MKIKNVYLLILLASLWGPSFLFIKVAVEEIPPLMLAALRIGIAALILNMLLLARGEKLPVNRMFWKKTLIAGLFAQGIPFVLINWGEQYVDSSLASILNGLVPLLTIILAHFLIENERLNAQKIAGVLVGFVGLIILIMPNLRQGFGGSAAGIGAITMAAISYGIGLTYIRKHFAGTSSFKAPAAQLLGVSIYLIPSAFAVNPDFTFSALSSATIGSVAMLSVFGTAVAFVVYFRLIDQSSAGYASQVTYLMPVYGVILGVIFLNEKVSVWILAGAALILLGIRIAKRSKRTRRKSFAVNLDCALYTKFR